MSDKTILVIGTYDTKDDELEFLAQVLRSQGGRVVTMDVSVLGDPSQPTDYSKHDVAQEGGSSIQAAIDSGDENHAMQIMAKGAAMLTARLFADADDPLGRRALRFELRLQGLAQSGRRRSPGCGARGHGT